MQNLYEYAGDQPHRGIYFLVTQSKQECWHFVSYLRLLRNADQIAEIYQQQLDANKACLMLVGNNDQILVEHFLAALLAGFSPVIMPAPMAMENADNYIQKIVASCSQIELDAIFSSDVLFNELASNPTIAPVYPFYTLDEEADITSCPSQSAQTNEFEYLQLTSGTSGGCKAVRVTSRALFNNLQSIWSWLGWSDRHATASWLPLNHDMGLVGCFLASLFKMTNLYLMSPEQFIRNPLSYLSCFDRHRTGFAVAHFSAMPPFGLSYLCRRIRNSQIVHSDFSLWRALIVGAERCSPKTLDEFQHLLAPSGFNNNCLCPAYGLAEVTLAATGSRPDQPWKTAREPDGNGSFSLVVSSGSPLDNNRVYTVDGNGNVLESGRIGELVIESNACAPYSHATSYRTCSYLKANVIATGDAGWVSDGEVFVIGRLGDACKIRGQWLFPEDIEARLVQRYPRLTGQICILLGNHRGSDMAVCLIKQKASRVPAGLKTVIEQAVENATCHIIRIPSNKIPRTTSGKIMRKSLWSALILGRLDEVSTLSCHWKNAHRRSYFTNEPIHYLSTRGTNRGENRKH